MCKSHNISNMDTCMKGLIKFLSRKESMFYVKTLGCCCGHNRYPMTIVVQNEMGLIYELISSKVIYRKKRFYLKDSKGYYYIPEVSEKIED